MSTANKILMGAAGAAGGGPSDDEFNRVSFLSHFDGENNGVNNAFDDGSTSNHTITANGNVTQGSFGPFAREAGYWGIDCANSSGIRSGLKLCEGYQTELVLTGTFTIEFWVFHRYKNGYQVFFGSGGGFSGWDSSTGHELTALCDSNNSLWCQFWNGSNNTNTAAITLNVGEWNHVAFVNSGGYWTTYLNGTGNTAVNHGNVVAISSTGTWASYIGCANGGSDSSPLIGIMSNARFVKGTAVYTSDFTPPTEPLTAITNTSSLVAQNNHFVDNSSHANTVTATGNIAVTAFGPFLTSRVYSAGRNGASAYFDGDADYLTIASSSDFDFGTSDFCWECWVFQTSRSSFQLIMAQDDYSTGNSISCWLTNTGQASIYYVGGGTHYTTTATVPLNTWTHLAWVRKGTSTDEFSIYINGTAEVSGTMATSFDQDGIIIGQQANGDYDFNGYVCDIRIANGSHIYTSNFTPPTAPLTAVTNTKLLLNMADGQAIDSAAQNNLTLIGNTDTSTGQAKFGNTSLFYDGSGDGAYYANGAALGTGDWTIETFLWVNDFDAKLGVFQYGGATGALASQVNTDQKLQVSSTSVSDRLITSGTINAQTWYHVAYVSYNGTIKVYINGTADSTTFDASSTTWTFTDTNVYVGARYYSNAVQRPFDGYLDEFRVSHFARYTSNFTAPSEPFADKGQDA